VLLSLDSSGDSPEALAELSVGARDGRLLSLREQLFGPRLTSVTMCPQCGQRLELTFHVVDLRRLPPVLPDALELDAHDYHVRFRLPTSADLSSAAVLADPDAARAHLLDRCIQSVSHLGAGGDEPDAPRPLRLPASVTEAVVARMSEADPQSDTRLDVSCPDCRHRWVAVFDIAAYLVREVHDRVAQLLREVHTLARAYGWHEADILAMTAARRQAYLQLVTQG
jgi:hypothetical protein